MREINISIDIHTDVTSSTDKTETLGIIAKILSADNNISTDELRTNLIKRENESTTGFGNGVAIPHAKVQGLEEPFIGVITFSPEVSWDSLDDQPVSIAIVLVMPDQNGSDKAHLKILSRLARKLMDNDFIKALKDAKHDKKKLSVVINEVL